MEVDKGSQNKVIVCIYEAIGTGFLLWSIAMQGPAETFGKFGVAFMVFALILIGGPVTGMHVNPAVTLGVFISNKHWKEDWFFCLCIILSEIAGGFWGICLAWCCLYNENSANPTKAQIPDMEVVRFGPAPGVSNWDAFQIEVLTTFIFVLTILLLKTQRTQPSKHGLLGGFMVGSLLLVIIIMAGPRSGACFNPSVGLNMTFYNVINFGWNEQRENNLWLYTLAPWTGSILAGIMHRGHLSVYRLFNEENETNRISEVKEAEEKLLNEQQPDVVKSE